MIRKLLENKGITATDAEFEELMEVVTDDIKFNHISFGKKTSIYEVIAISLRTANVLRRCNLDGNEIYDNSGQTIADVDSLDFEKIEKLLDIKKTLCRGPK